MEVKIKSFIKKISALKRICIDTSVLICHLEKIKPYDSLTRIMIEDIASGNIFCNISAITIMELFAKPYEAKNQEQVKTIEEFIYSFPNTKIQPVDYEISKRASEIRAQYVLTIPESILFSTTMLTNSNCLITGNSSLKKHGIKGIKIIALNDFL